MTYRLARASSLPRARDRRTRLLSGVALFANGFPESGWCHKIAHFHAPNMAAVQRAMTIHSVHCQESG